MSNTIVRRTASTILATAGIAMMAPASLATIAPFFHDFEASDQTSPSALADLGWVVGANVFDPTGTTFLYNYFTFPAPNGGPAFSGIDIGQGGPDQGDQQLVVYNDYNNADHNIGNRIEANVFREFSITADDVGKTYEFSFQAKLGNLAGATTAIAFIKTLDPGAGFFVTNFISEDMTSIPDTWGGFTLSLTIDGSLVGQLFQVGFANTASNFDPSGIFYDNILLNNGDFDGDGVADSADNCTLLANPGQQDTNGDGFGNACDTDLNGDCITNPIDLGIFKSRFFTPDPDADFDSSGIVNALDLGRLKLLFFQPPGPSALAACP